MYFIIYLIFKLIYSSSSPHSTFRAFGLGDGKGLNVGRCLRVGCGRFEGCGGCVGCFGCLWWSLFFKLIKS